MDVKPCHKALQKMLIKILKQFFISIVQPGYQQTLKCSDTDNVKYRIYGKAGQVSLYLICIDVDVIWNYANQYFTKTYYPQFAVKLSEFKNQKAVEIKIDNDILTKLTQSYKDPNNEDLKGKKKVDAVLTHLSKRLACVKRHFFASPFEIMLIAAKNNVENKPTGNITNLCFYTKPDRKEKIWLAFEKNQFTVYYGFSFDDKFQQQLAKIYFSQLVDAKKHVHHAPAVAVYESQLSEFLVKSFPQEKKQTYQFTNGIVSMKALYGNFVKSVSNMGTFLSGFRNYAYYHIQASKCYIHSRVMRRITNFQKDLNLSKVKEQQPTRYSSPK